MKYIDAEKLNSLIDTKLDDLGMSGSVWVGRSVLNELKDDIESLQQEQTEVDFEDKFAKFLERKDAELGAEPWSEEDLRELAMYFYSDKNNKKPEVDLEKELNKWRHKHFKGKRDDDYNGEYLERASQLDIARHFWNKGYNARKEK